MGKAATLAALAFMFAGGTYAFNTQRTVAEGRKTVSRHQMEVLARTAALAGHSQAKQKLADNFASTSAAGTYEGVGYEYDVTADPGTFTVGSITFTLGSNEASIISTGTYDPGGNDDAVTFTVQSRYERETKLPDDVPPCFGYAVCADDEVHMNGNIEVLYAGGEASNRLNANIHSNGELDVRGNSVDVRGFGSYSGYLSGNHQEAAFDPYDNDADQPNLQRVESIDVPVFSPSDALSPEGFGAADRTDHGDVDLSSVASTDFTDESTREEPYVWHVKGNLVKPKNGNSDIHVKGYVVFVVEGDITLRGKNRLTTTSENDESNAAFYTAGNATVELKGGSELHGQIYAGNNADISLKGGSEFYGTIATGGSVTLSGNPTLHYRPASPALTQNWQDMDDLLRRTSYSAE